MREAAAFLGGLHATGLVDVTADLAALDTTGRWAVAVPYTGEPVCARFDSWTAEEGLTGGPWVGPSTANWRSSLDQGEYVAAVEATRAAIAAGTVYQANICRVLSADLLDADSCDVSGLFELLRRGNPAPYGGFLSLPAHGVHIASASPELFVSLRRARDGRVIRSGPIKGTGRTVADLTDKDRAENIMIVDLVRNDLSRVCATGTVTVPSLLQVQEHPGLVHLVSFVEGRLMDGTTWPDVIDATFPPGSVTGAPKSSALRMIDALEPEARSFYCGAFGWVDADSGEAELAVAIRTFWIDGSTLKFGTGAGITWSSDPEAEWRECELKAARLVELASGRWQADDS